MKILVVGNGGREHALSWKLSQSKQVSQVFVAPGNGGTSLETNISNVPIAPTDIEKLLQFAKDEAIDLTVIGPEAPLVNGIVDQFEEAGLNCFGPNRTAAQLEGSKAFTKDFLARHQIPTAAYSTFTEINTAIAYIKEQGAPIVVKADGLAAGKGVIVAISEEQAIAAVKDMLAGNRFGDAGHRVIIEQFLEGEEASFICLIDGEDIIPFASSQDHKAAFDGDQGPNTGGMGAYSPAPVVTPIMHTRIMDEVIKPTVKGLKQDGIYYRGFLYAGIMIDPKGNPQVLEYNCRFGDPETQPIMMRLQTDLFELITAAMNHQLSSQTIQFDQRAALGVVLAAEGYPDAYKRGEVIHAIPNATADCKVFHAGTTLQTHDMAQRDIDTNSNQSNIITSGGRVLCATALGDSIKEAQSKAYELINQIDWPTSFYRTDIGAKGIELEGLVT